MTDLGGRALRGLSRLPVARTRLVLLPAVFVALILACRVHASLATSAEDMPPSLRAVPMGALLGAFSVSYETPSIAAEDEAEVPVRASAWQEI